MKDLNNAVLNGTYKKLTHGVGIVDTVNSDKINVTVYLSDRERFLSQYTAFAVTTAQSTVEMCRVVYEAKTELSAGDFDKFCTDIGRNKTDSTIRKYLAIGGAYLRLISYANLLPNSWTSIYEITQIPADAFDALVKTGNSMATLTGAQVKRLKDLNNKSDAAATVTDAGAATTTSDADAAMNVTDTATATTVTDAGADTTATDTAVAMTLTEVGTATTVTDASDAMNVTDTATATTVIDAGAADLAHAHQATASLLERVSSQSTASVEVASQTYEILIRFKKPPSEDKWFELLDQLEDFHEANDVDFEVIDTRPSFAASVAA